MSRKIKLDFQINRNIYYRTGTIFLVITLLINILTNYEVMSIEWKEIRLFTVSVGIPLYFYGTFVHYKTTKDVSFVKQTLVGFLIGLTIIAIVFISR
jgi:hypothetical protein